jgi:hypothetical protein
MKNEDFDKLMDTIGNGGGGALVAIVASLMAIIKSQPNFDHSRFNEEISSLIAHPNTTEIQKKLWTCLLQQRIAI